MKGTKYSINVSSRKNKCESSSMNVINRNRMEALSSYTEVNNDTNI